MAHDVVITAQQLLLFKAAGGNEIRIDVGNGTFEVCGGEDIGLRPDLYRPTGDRMVDFQFTLPLFACQWSDQAHDAGSMPALTFKGFSILQQSVAGFWQLNR